METKFETLKNGGRVTLYPSPGNLIHKTPVKAVYQSGYFYCDGTPPTDGPDYYLGDVLAFCEGWENEQP